ncbi:unnamed protein product, partial [Trichobilharzia regenti]
ILFIFHRAELEAYYANLTQEVDKHRADLDTHIKNDQILIETLEPNASKALQMKANRIAPMAYEVYKNNKKSAINTSDGLSNDDPLNMLRIKFAQRNQGACTFKDQMSQLIYGSDDNRVNSQRNKYGHSSDSTIQHILYGKGVGPSSRPSGEFILIYSIVCRRFLLLLLLLLLLLRNPVTTVVIGILD